MGYFREISIFVGCTAGRAAAMENININNEEKLLENIQKMGEYAMVKMHELKEKYTMVGDVRGKGLFLGIELLKDRSTKEPADESVAAGIAADCMKNGVINGRINRSHGKFNNTLCLAPALIATKDDIDEIMTTIDNAL